MIKKSTLPLLTIALLFLLAAGALAQTTKLQRIGVYTFARVRGDIPTAEVMKTLVDRYAGDIKVGFDLAGHGELYVPFMEQLQKTRFEDTAVPVGDVLPWMLFRSQGKVKVARNIEWAGRAPLEVFAIKVEKDYKTYEFVIPKPCGNIALRKITDAVPPPVCALAVSPNRVNIGDPVTVDMSATKHAQSMSVDIFDAQGNKVASQKLAPANAKWQTTFDKPGEYVFKGGATNAAGVVSTNPCEAKVYVNAPPICVLDMTCQVCEDYVGRPIVFDASRSTDPDGTVVRASFELMDASGTVVDSYVASQPPFIWERVFTREGNYTIDVTVFDNDGAASAPSETCRTSFRVTRKKLFWLVEAGPLLAKGTYTTYGFLRGGIFAWLSPDQFSVVLSAGGAIPSVGSPWKFMFMANALANVHAGPVYFGAGLGYSTKAQDYDAARLDADGNLYYDHKSGLDAVGNVGIELFNRYTSVGSLFFEFRSPLGGDRAFDTHHKFALGFRLVF